MIARTVGLLLPFALLLPGSAVRGQDTPAQEASPPAQAEPLPAFKGPWRGPSERLLPGPGPKPGQSLKDYFESLPQGSRVTQPLHVLVLGGSVGFHHDSIPAAMDMVFRSGEKSHLWKTEFATDFALVNAGGGEPMRAGFQPQGLKDFDAVVVASATGEWPLSEAQKKALIAFVHDEGKGLVVIHGGLDANHSWKDYIDMVGGEFTGHPFNTPEKVVVSFKIINEEPDFPAVRHFAHTFRKQDEFYVNRNISRDDVNVLLRLDEADQVANAVPKIETQLPPDRDIPVAWSKRYGKGRVFASSLGHPPDAFEDPELVTMYSEAIKWALGLSEGPSEAPHPRPQGGSTDRR